MADPNSSNRKLRILCLHGYSQNAEVSQNQEKALCSLRFKFEYVSRLNRSLEARLDP